MRICGTDPLFMDGNILSDARWTYTWDAENRLVHLAGRVTGVQPTSVDYEYDWQGRRIKKVVVGTTTTTTKYLYDGWNLVAELDGSNNLLRTYGWGMDLSGSLTGAGGVGGLLFAKPASTGVADFCAYDGNGNVMALLDGSNASVSAQYEYGAFGELLRATGTMATSNPSVSRPSLPMTNRTWSTMGTATTTRAPDGGSAEIRLGRSVLRNG
jgi:hypothetical protein